MSSAGKGSFVTVVSGVPRSGTSLMMQMLHAGGVPILTDNHRPPDPANPRGYFEFEPVKRLRSDHQWLPQAIGCAVKIIHLLVRELPADGRFQYRIILMRRPLREIVLSQRAMLEREGKTAADNERLITIYQTQLQGVLTWAQSTKCVRMHEFEYHRVLHEPLVIATELQSFLETRLNVAAMAAVVTPALCHHQLTRI